MPTTKYPYGHFNIRIVFHVQISRYPFSSLFVTPRLTLLTADHAHNLKSLALAFPKIIQGVQNSKTNRVTPTMPLSGMFRHGRLELGLAMTNPCIIYEASIFTCYKDMRDDAKCTERGGFRVSYGSLKVISK